MTRFFLRLTGMYALLCLVVLSASLFIGRLIPSSTLAFNGPGETFTLVDTRQGITSKVTGPAFTTIRNSSLRDTGCFRQFAEVYGGGRVGLSYFDSLGRTHYYRDEYAQMQVGSAIWLPDKRHLMVNYSDEAGPSEYHYEILDSQTGRVLPLDISGQLNGPADVWSPDGRQGVIYVFESEQAAFLVDTATGKVTMLENALSPLVSWSPDGRYLASATLTGQLNVLDTRTMTDTSYAVDNILNYTGLIWTSADELTFFAQKQSATQTRIYHWTPDSLPPQPVAFVTYSPDLPDYPVLNTISPDRTKFVYRDAVERSTHIINTQTGNHIISLLPQPDGYTLFYTWSPDSRYFIGFDGLLDMLTVYDTQSGNVYSVDLYPGPTKSPAGVPQWLNDSELALFLPGSSILGRLMFTDGAPAFVVDFQLPGAYFGVFCETERAA